MTGADGPAGAQWRWWRERRLRAERIHLDSAAAGRSSRATLADDRGPAEHGLVGLARPGRRLFSLDAVIMGISYSGGRCTSTSMPSRMRSRPKMNSSSGSSKVSKTPAAMNAVSAGNRCGSVSWLSMRG